MVRERNPRIGRNPRTGEEAPISKGKTIKKFKPGKEFKERVGKSHALPSPSKNEKRNSICRLILSFYLIKL